MKKSLWMFLVLGLAFAVQGCGFDPTIDSSVMIVKVTPTPEATPTPEVTPNTGSNSNTGGYHRTDSQWSQCRSKRGNLLCSIRAESSF